MNVTREEVVELLRHGGAVLLMEGVEEPLFYPSLVDALEVVELEIQWQKGSSVP